MEKMETILATFLGFLLVLGHRFAEGCSCAPAHPQEQFCRDSYAIKATIMSNETVTLPGMSFATQLIYQAKIDRVFKGDDMKEGDTVAISTPTMDSLCGRPNLQEGKKYILTGSKYDDKLYHNLCNMAKEWNQVSVFQRKGLRNFYKKSCDECEIMSSYGYQRNTLPVAKQCSFDAFQVYRSDGLDCESRYSTCIQQTKGSCNWLTTPAYEECVLLRDSEGSGFL